MVIRPDIIKYTTLQAQPSTLPTMTTNFISRHPKTTIAAPAWWAGPGRDHPGQIPTSFLDHTRLPRLGLAPLLNRGRGEPPDGLDCILNRE